jgi:hypothetical protein
MGKDSVLVWDGRADATYREVRRQIASRNGHAPQTAKEIDFARFFQDNSDSLAYFPVFQGTTGWWGELLGTDAKIRSKIIVSPECQLYEIGRAPFAADRPLLEWPPRVRQLHVAEAMPQGKFFQKLKDAAAQIKDMIATDAGTVLTLLVGGNGDRIKNCVQSAGGEYLGSIGGY